VTLRAIDLETAPFSAFKRQILLTNVAQRALVDYEIPEK